MEATHGALIELAKAVAKGRFDDVEPRLAPALTQAAKDLADRRLADPELSPAMLARELNVSVRTLHRHSPRWANRWPLISPATGDCKRPGSPSPRRQVA